MGRPIKHISDGQLMQIEKLASRGLTVEQICAVLRMNKSTLYKRAKEKKQIMEALERGRAGGIMKVVNALFDDAIAGNTTAQIFFLRNRDPKNWNKQSEKLEVDMASTVEVEVSQRRGLADYYEDIKNN